MIGTVGMVGMVGSWVVRMVMEVVLCGVVPCGGVVWRPHALLEVLYVALKFARKVPHTPEGRLGIVSGWGVNDV